MNLYTYVHNNPLIHTDPTGHCVWDACVAEGTAATYGVIAAAAAIGVGLAILDDYLFGNEPYPISQNHSTPKNAEQSNRLADTLTSELATASSLNVYEKKRKKTEVYLWGNATPNNLTPRISDVFGVDGCDANPNCGLSMTLTKPRDMNYVTFNLEDLLLNGFEAYNDHGKHITVRPRGNSEKSSTDLLREWSASRYGVSVDDFNKGVNNHAYTIELKRLIIGTVKIKK